MTALAIALSYASTLALAAFWLWLRDYGRAARAMKAVEQLKTDLREEHALAIDTLAAKNSSARAELEAAIKAGLAEVKAESATVKREMDALATAVSLTRAGQPFTQRPNGAQVPPGLR